MVVPETKNGVSATIFVVKSVAKFHLNMCLSEIFNAHKNLVDTF